MKKLLSLFTLLLLFTATKAIADPTELTGTMAVSTIGEAATSIDTDTWYLVWQGNKTANGYTGGYMWDYGYNTTGTYGEMHLSLGGDVVYADMLATDAAEYLIRFIPTTVDGFDDYEVYYMQFGTGNYVWVPSTNSTALQTIETIDEAVPVYTYHIGDVETNFAFNITDGTDYQINQNGPGNIVLTYETGTTDRPNAEWQIYPVSFKTVSEEDAAYQKLLTVYSQYIGYEDSFDDYIGTTYGCYDAEAVAAFKAALEAVASLDDPNNPEMPSSEEMEAMAETIVSTYDAVIASKIPMQVTDIADGYYYLISGNPAFYETTESTTDPETGEEVEGDIIYPTKAIYSEASGETIYALWKTHEETVPFLWKVTNQGNGEYEVVNMATDATFDDVTMNESVTMSVDNGNLIAFDYGSVTDEGNYLVYIRPSHQDEDAYHYLHCGGHDNGAGVSGNIIGWLRDKDPSSWVITPVDTDVAEAMIEEYAPTKDASQRYQNALTMIADAEEKMVIATDVTIGTEGLIQTADQLSSPHTCPVEGQGNDIAALIDGDTDTFWQSNWHYGDSDYPDYPDVPEIGSQYFQVELTDIVTDNIVFTFTRRVNNNNLITQWGVYGSTSTSEDVTKDDCTLLANISTPYTTQGETLTSEAFSTQGFQVIRFYIEETTGGSYFTHIAEFQLYTASENPTSQKAAMGSVYTNLETAIAKAEEEGEDITATTYTTLKTAYDAFIAMYVDPTELRSTLAEASTASASMVFGTNPGEWSDNSSADALASTISSATAYDAAGKYTQEESDTYVATLQAQMEGITEAANKIAEGKWYKIRYATEAEMEANGWSLSNGAASGASQELYGKYACAANIDNSDDDYWPIDPLAGEDLEDVCIGQQIHFADADDLKGETEDDALFRFVAVGDTAYLMQNKATGLFIKAAGTSGAVSLSIHPTLFNVSALGYGQNLISGETLDGESCANLHAQLNSNVLVTWSAAEAGSNSGFYIEDAGSVEESYDGSSFNMSIQAGVINAMCWPVDVTATEGTIYGEESIDGTTVTLAPMSGNTAPAGTPFFYINGTTDDYDADEVEDILSFAHGMEVAQKALTKGKAVGTYYGESVGAGKLIASANELTVSKSTSSVGANSAYIDGEYSSDAVIVIEYSEGVYESIEEVMTAVAQSGDIYTIDGKLVGKGNLNTVKTLGKGIYIVGGVKVLVK